MNRGSKLSKHKAERQLKQAREFILLTDPFYLAMKGNSRKHH